MSFLSGFRKSEISWASGACWRKIHFHTGGLSVPKCFVLLCLFKPLHIVEHAAPSHPHNVKRLVECLFVSIFPCRSLLYNTTLAASYVYQINTPVMFLKWVLFHHMVCIFSCTLPLQLSSLPIDNFFSFIFLSFSEEVNSISPLRSPHSHLGAGPHLQRCFFM